MRIPNWKKPVWKRKLKRQNLNSMKEAALLQDSIEEAFREYIETWNHTAPHNLYRPVSYALAAGGKRLRPLLVLLGYQLFRDDVEKALPAAAAIEIFHNFTLLHDDIMDKADLRRGEPTVHQKFGENSAILSGDVMAFLSYRFLLKTLSEHTPKVVQLFSDTAVEVCEGQQYDMDFETRTDVSAPEYMEMIRLKTAVLLGCSLQTGALLAGAPEVSATRLYEAGISLGLAFQLRDDLLDTFGEEATFGKKIGGDITSNKKTFLLIRALEKANPAQRASLLDWMNRENFDREEKITAVRSLYEALEIKEETEAQIDRLHTTALSLLATLAVDPARRIPLETLCEGLIKRRF